MPIPMPIPARPIITIPIGPPPFIFHASTGVGSINPVTTDSLFSFNSMMGILIIVMFIILADILTYLIKDIREGFRWDFDDVAGMILVVFMTLFCSVMALLGAAIVFQRLMDPTEKFGMVIFLFAATTIIHLIIEKVDKSL